MTTYIHELVDWPEFHWNGGRLAAPLATARHAQGRLVGHMEALGFKVREEAVLRTITEDVLKSSEIEGEKLDADQVRSSVARRLGMDIGGLRPADRHVDGVVEMMLDATQHYEQPLTAERLFGWHASLFPTGRSGMHRITVGAWRADSAAPMQVVSRPVGRERVHFEAPGADRLEGEMRRFLEWFNTDVTMEPVLKAALAHLWFVTGHPFDDGNGRMARAIADMSLARSEASPQRFYSMSAQIREERGDYYGILERTQQGALDVTAWMEWFLACLTRAIEGAQTALSAVIESARYWETLRDVPINERQRLVIHRMLEGFDGKLTTSKWAALTKSSNDTALRDIQQLVDRGILMRNPCRRAKHQLLRRSTRIDAVREPGDHPGVTGRHRWRRRRVDHRRACYSARSDPPNAGAVLPGPAATPARASAMVPAARMRHNSVLLGNCSNTTGAPARRGMRIRDLIPARASEDPTPSLRGHTHE